MARPYSRYYDEAMRERVFSLLPQLQTAHAIARHMGVSAAWVNGVLSEAGLGRRCVRRTVADRKRAVELYRAGLSISQVAEKFVGNAEGWVRKVINEAGISRWNEARLDRAAEVVYRRRDLGESYPEIRAAMGVSPSFIARHLKRAGLVKRRRKARRRAA